MFDGKVNVDISSLDTKTLQYLQEFQTEYLEKLSKYREEARSQQKQPQQQHQNAIQQRRSGISKAISDIAQNAQFGGGFDI